MSSIQIRSSTVDYDSDWTEYRRWLDGIVARLPYTWSENDYGYNLAALDGPVFRTATVLKTDPPNAAQLDFEANYKSSNVPFETRSENGGLVVAQSPWAYSTEGTRFVGQAYTCAPGTTTHEFAPGVSVRLQGGYYWCKGPNLGDRIDFLIVDVDNVLGMGAGLVVSEYVKEMPVTPWDHQGELIAPTAGEIPAGLYLRVVYTNTGTEDVNFGITYRWFQS